jgi:phenylalanyl-tRNA synthetase beta chain
VVNTTTRILLESAHFDPLSVRRTARALGVASESSYRFERGIDPQGVEAASRRAAGLMVTYAGGRESAVKDVGMRVPKRLVMSLEPMRVQRWLGASLQPAKAARALSALGFSVRRQAARWTVSVPSFRRDVRQDVDLIEELARLTGYERLKPTVPCAPLGTGSEEGTQRYRRVQALRNLCTQLGLWEVVTWTLVADADLKPMNPPGARHVRLSNPLSQDHAVLRPTLLVGMLRAVAKNLGHGARAVRFFELGNVVHPGTTPQETLQLGIGLSGSWERSWQGTHKIDLFRLKGMVEQFVSRVSREPLRAATSSRAWAEPGQCMHLFLDDQPLGDVGQVARRVCEAFDIEEPVWFGELAVEVLLSRARASVKTAPFSAFPPVKRDLSFLVERRVAFAELLQLIQTTGFPLASHVELIDRYTDHPQVPTTHHSLTFSIEYRDPRRTLTATEVDQLHHRIGQALIERFGAQIR